MKQGSTKGRILEAALTLFAEKGYDGTSVDQIAAAAGLKGPSLYKHFKSKEEILDVLLTQGEAHYSESMKGGNSERQLPASMEELNQMAKGMINFTLHDPMVKKVRRLLTIEQFRNPRLASLATKHNMTGIQKSFQSTFEGMMEAGSMKKGNSEILSFEFIAPITLLIQICDREPEREDEILKRIDTLLENFAGKYGTNPDADIR